MSRFFTKKYIIWGLVILAVVFAGYLVLRKKPVAYKAAYTVAAQDVRQTVISTGTVTSQSNLSLAFKSSGILTRLYVKVGDKVRAGRILAQLDEKDASASIAQANAQVLSAQANLDKVLNGASGTDIDVAQVALNNAKASLANTKTQQQTLVSNALSAMLNSGIAAIPAVANLSTATIAVSGTYTGTQQGADTITVSAVGGGFTYNVTGLDTASGFINRGVAIPIGSHGLNINFSLTGNFASSDTWTISIPNIQSTSYLNNYNAYQAALQTQSQAVSTAQGSVDSAQAALDQKKAAARPEDVDAAKASLAQAKASLQIAQNAFANNIILAPISGQITTVSIKLGEQVTALKPALVLLDQNSLHVESNIPESSISLVAAGQAIDMTLDALGPDKHLQGQILSIDPASIVVSGVIEFRVISSLPTDPSIKPGMTVNLNIIIADKPNTLAIPNRLINTSDHKRTVTVLKQSKPQEIEITTGLAGDNYTEVVSGLSSGDVLVTVTP
ncbi:MAG: efflux RND transporter periplasmic adaptor subunit [Candidatus Doudnabacteria bacterium]